MRPAATGEGAWPEAAGCDVERLASGGMLSLGGRAWNPTMVVPFCW
jgi:hypothetical protein